MGVVKIATNFPVHQIIPENKILRWGRRYIPCPISIHFDVNNKTMILKQPLVFIPFLNLYLWPRSNLSRPRINCKSDKIKSENQKYFKPGKIRSENLKYLHNLFHCPWYWGSMRPGPLGNPGHPSRLICSHLTNPKQFALSERPFLLPVKLTTCAPPLQPLLAIYNNKFS